MKLKLVSFVLLAFLAALSFPLAQGIGSNPPPKRCCPINGRCVANPSCGANNACQCTLGEDDELVAASLSLKRSADALSTPQRRTLKSSASAYATLIAKSVALSGVKQDGGETLVVQRGAVVSAKTGSTP